MECKEICKLVCGYMDNELEPVAKKLFEKHLAECDYCKSEIESYQSVKMALKLRTPFVKAPTFLKEKIFKELDRIDEYRETGIETIDLLRWGSHIAQLYDGKDEISELVTPYIIKGLEQNELCVWVLSGLSQCEAENAIIYYLPNAKMYMDKGQLEILSYKDWYLSEGRFDAQIALKSAADRYKDAVYNGYSGLRVAGNPCWVSRNDWEAFIDFEGSMNNVMVDEKILAMCSYNQQQCAKERITDVMNTHKYVLFKTNDFWRLKRQIEQSNRAN
jgi:hypothetical protein